MAQSNKHQSHFAFEQVLSQNASTPTIPPLPTQFSQVRKDIKLPNTPKASTARDAPREAFTKGPGSYSGTNSKARRNLPLPRKGSPWDTYRKEFSCDLAGDAAVVVHRTDPSKVLLLRSFPGDIAEKVLQWLNQLQHPNIMGAKMCYSAENSLYALCEDLPLTLEHLIVCGARLTEVQLSAILSQILDALSYLAAEGFEHRSVKSSNVLMGLDGVVKIGYLQDIHSQSQTQDQTNTLKALETITMELMGGTAGMNDVKQWPLDSDAVTFLLATASVGGSVGELRKHRLITKYADSKGELIGLARFALISARTFYSYP
ncbi:uncharacterized protein TRUGW13939_10365 [Talaromyces rugulosus]|uniref:Protein kinase domain-containing protein n=1 Tax=Talaromyces rugulosus TaxID=121627 RepID=A0A7H8RA61_TALRU|nr:uncharacterized protein TRUGW13939_10365 [Talaromyces rugulosus]QKX63196.1 hypothetical protein TRUGW13939_10365 [Talaromyces rugulosus]